jgi:hypothetical protein
MFQIIADLSLKMGLTASYHQLSRTASAIVVKTLIDERWCVWVSGRGEAERAVKAGRFFAESNFSDS